MNEFINVKKNLSDMLENKNRPSAALFSFSLFALSGQDVLFSSLKFAISRTSVNLLFDVQSENNSNVRLTEFKQKRNAGSIVQANSIKCVRKNTTKQKK